MSALLEQPPFSARDDAMLLREMNELSRWHLCGCDAYRAVWPSFAEAQSFAELPFLHVGVFKHRIWRIPSRRRPQRRIPQRRRPSRRIPQRRYNNTRRI
jgi:hypothetical protein